MLSGRLLESRGAIIPALSASGLSTGAVRRAWAALAYGAWQVGLLLVKFQDLVRREGPCSGSRGRACGRWPWIRSASSGRG
jgi:hypothetical protein